VYQSDSLYIKVTWFKVVKNLDKMLDNTS